MKRLSAFRTLWVYAFVELRTGTPVTNNAARRFRRWLVRNGWRRVQGGVYQRSARDWQHADELSTELGARVPMGGEARVLAVTDKQFERTRVFWGPRLCLRTA